MTVDNAQQAGLFSGCDVVALGIDPGTIITGWGLVARKGRKLEHLENGTLRPREKACLEWRLAFLADRLRTLLDRLCPQVVGIEEQFVPRESAKFRSALMVAQARGVLAAVVGRDDQLGGHAKIPLLQFPAPTVKKAVAAHGRADKEQVQRAVAMLLGLGATKLQPDAADALAVGVCAALSWRPGGHA